MASSSANTSQRGVQENVKEEAANFSRLTCDPTVSAWVCLLHGLQVPPGPRRSLTPQPHQGTPPKLHATPDHRARPHPLGLAPT